MAYWDDETKSEIIIEFSSGCSMKGTSEQPCILVQCDGHHLVVLEGDRCQLKQQQHIHYSKTYQTVCRSARLNCRLAQKNCNTGPQVKFRVADMNLLSCDIFCSCGTFWGSSTACRTCKVVKLIAFKWLRSSNLKCAAFLCTMKKYWTKFSQQVWFVRNITFLEIG